MGVDKVDYSLVPQDLKDKVAKWEANKPENKQLAALGDLQAVLEHLVITLEQGQTATETDVKQLGAVLVDMRTSLAALATQEAPESPDYASPVVGAVKELETALTAALNAVEVKPNIRVEVPKIDTPQVNVSPPSVDLKGVEQILKTELPKAFRAAISAIPEAPETDLNPLLIQLQAMSEQLASIETATRLKPLPPSTIKVTNTDGSDVRPPSIFREYDDIAFSNADVNGNYQTIGFKLSGVTKNVLTLTFDGSSNVTHIVRS